MGCEVSVCECMHACVRACVRVCVCVCVRVCVCDGYVSHSRSMKRMAGEDVFGYKIKTALEPPTPFDTKMQMMENISGPALGQSFPPRATPPLVNPPFRSPPTPPRRMDPFPPLRSHAPQMGPPLRGPMPPPPHAFPPPQPRPPPPFTQARPHTPMGYPPGPRLPSPFWPSAPLPTPSQLPPGPIPRPEGKILIYKILPIPETDFEKLNGQFVSLRLSASVKVSSCRSSFMGIQGVTV